MQTFRKTNNGGKTRKSSDIKSKLTAIDKFQPLSTTAFEKLFIRFTAVGGWSNTNRGDEIVLNFIVECLPAFLLKDQKKSLAKEIRGGGLPLVIHCRKFRALAARIAT